jgi:translation initiation factor IF-3
LKKPLVNNQIRASQVRVIDESGKQLGIFNLNEAIQMAIEKNLDLVQVTEKVDPPVCKMVDYGKYLYSLSKKERSAKHKISDQVKVIRLGFNISLHDLEMRVNLAKKFLEKSGKVRVELPLKGREKTHEDFAKEKIEKFLSLLKDIVPIKIERELKRGPGDLSIIISAHH